MAKKPKAEKKATTASSKKAPAKKAAVKKVAKKAATTSKATTKGTPTTRKKAAAKPKSTTPRKRPAKAAFTQEDVALRAYFIAEKRQKDGLHGTNESDWIEAERQLASESKPKTKRAPARKKPAKA